MSEQIIEKEYYEPMHEENGSIKTFDIHFQICNTKGITAFAHFHEHLEILYCTGGSFEIYLDGKLSTFVEGDMVVINSKEVHKIESLTPYGGYFCLRFVPEILYTSSNTDFDFKYVMPFLLYNSNHQRVFPSEEIKDTCIPDLIRDIANEHMHEPYGYELAIKTNLSRMFLWIIRYWDKKDADLLNTASIGNDMMQTIKKAIDYISLNYNQSINAADAAKICNLSYSYFSRIFKNYMKRGFSEYLNFIRINNAERLLISTDLPITEVADSCGFTTTSYFIKQFKEAKGISPKQFRRNFSKNKK